MYASIRLEADPTVVVSPLLIGSVLFGALLSLLLGRRPGRVS
jgi:hypothetical protein